MSETVHKVKSSFSIVDESFSIDKCSGYTLFIEAGFDVFSFAILDAARNKFIALQTFSLTGVFSDTVFVERLDEIYEQTDMLKQKYKSVSACFINDKYTLLPAPLFEKEKAAVYLNLNHPAAQGEVVCADTVLNIDSFTVYAIPDLVLKRFNKLFPGIRVQHFVSPLIDCIISQYKNKTKRKVFVHVQPTHFEVIVAEGKKLIFFNSFRHQTSEDFIYYLLFVCEQLHLNPEEMDLVLLGEIEKNAALYQILYKYIRHISFGARHENSEYSYKFDTVPVHFYYSLLSQSLANN